VRISLDEELLTEKPLQALEPVESGDFLDRAMDEILLWFE
jgi:hypothetical protein